MPSTSPGTAPTTPTAFTHISPGAPNLSLQGVTTFLFQFKRYVAYVAGCHLNLLSAPNVLIQVLTFPEEVVAIAVEAITGKIVVAGKDELWTLVPATEGWTKIWWEKALLLQREDAEDEARYLSWGNEGEVLLGGTRHLSLFSTLSSSRTSPPSSPIDTESLEVRTALWSKDVPSPIQYAAFSPSASLIATCSIRDRLVKIWRRLSFEDGLFDYTYLPHPSTVTHLQWRPLDSDSGERSSVATSTRQEELSEVLYTVSHDGLLRVWKTMGIHDLEIMVLHTTIDLVASIPHSPSLVVKDSSSQSSFHPRYFCTIPSDQFRSAVNSSLGLQALQTSLSPSLEHLRDAASKELDVVISFDGSSRMSAWGLHSIGHKRRPGTQNNEPTLPYHIAHTEGLPLRIQERVDARLEVWVEGKALNLLVHCFDGSVRWMTGAVEDFFSPSVAGNERLREAARWSGHNHGQITSLRSSTDGSSLVSTDASGDRMRWSLNDHGMLCTIKCEDSVKVDSRNARISERDDFAYIRSTNGASEASVSANQRELSIFDLADRYLEYQQISAVEIKQIVLAPRRSLMAVRYEVHVDVLVRGRYSYAVRFNWTLAKRISFAGIGLQLSGLAWLSNGSLAVTAGNGLFLSSPETNVEIVNGDPHSIIGNKSNGTAEGTQDMDLLALEARIRRPVQVWHPDLVLELVNANRWRLATNILEQLAHKLRFWTEGEEIDPLLDVPVERDYDAGDVEKGATLDPKTNTELLQQLDAVSLPTITYPEQQQLRRIVQTMNYCSVHLNALDTGARRYLFAWRLQMFCLEEAEQPNAVVNGHASPSIEMQWREIAFAHHSATQQPLLDILIEHYDNKITWDTARRLGLFAWLSDREAVAGIFEALAQSAYRSTSPPDPINASLYFLALHKKATLLGLWRIATWHKEQRSTMNFLRRDFGLPEHKTAAKKNAYALMGRRRFDYAAAFFLLADDAQSATSVLAGQYGDIMLAIAVARLYNGDNSAVLAKLLEDRLIPEAGRNGDRWLLSWCYSMLGDSHRAAEILVEPFEGVTTWQQDEPAALDLYKVLRRTPSQHEYKAVLRGARITRRMGLWLSALQLVSQWRFVAPTTSNSEDAATHGAVRNEKSQTASTPSMLDEFAAEEPTSKPADTKEEDDLASRQEKAAALLEKMKEKKAAATTLVVNEKKPEPTQFKEPEANSLLDSFGF